MKYDKIVEAFFIERPNRFIARVKIDGAEEVELVHVKNTGRCRELLLARGGSDFGRLHRKESKIEKTRYDMIVLNQSMPLETAGWIGWKSYEKMSLEGKALREREIYDTRN